MLLHVCVSWGFWRGKKRTFLSISTQREISPNFLIPWINQPPLPSLQDKPFPIRGPYRTKKVFLLLQTRFLFFEHFRYLGKSHFPCKNKDLGKLCSGSAVEPREFFPFPQAQFFLLGFPRKPYLIFPGWKLLDESRLKEWILLLLNIYLY